MEAGGADQEGIAYTKGCGHDAPAFGRPSLAAVRDPLVIFGANQSPGYLGLAPLAKRQAGIYDSGLGSPSRSNILVRAEKLRFPLQRPQV